MSPSPEAPAAEAKFPDDLKLARAAAVDQQAFKEIYLRHGDKIFDRVSRKLGPVPEREDIMQQVFMALHRSLPRFRGECTLATFLFQITTYVLSDHRRKRRRRITTLDDEGVERLIDSRPTPEAHSGSRQRLEFVLSLFQHVKPERQIALRLVALEGLSLADVASLVGAKPHAVKQRVSKARREISGMMSRAERPSPAKPAGDGRRKKPPAPDPR